MKKETSLVGTVVAAQPGFYLLSYCYDPSYKEKPFEYWAYPVVAWAVDTEYCRAMKATPIALDDLSDKEDTFTVLYPDGRVGISGGPGSVYESVDKWIEAITGEKIP